MDTDNVEISTSASRPTSIQSVEALASASWPTSIQMDSVEALTSASRECS